MSAAAIVAPVDFLGEGVGLGLSLGVGDGVASGVSPGVGVAVDSGDGDAIAFLRFGEGEGEFFDFGVAVGSGVRLGFGLDLGDALDFGEGLDDGEGLGLAVGEGFGLALGLGDGVGVGFFLVVEAFRFFGGGVGSKIRLIFVPSDSSALSSGARAPNATPRPSKRQPAVFQAARLNAPVPLGSPCSAGSRHRNSPAESSR